MECVVACHDKSQMKNHLAFQALRTMSVAIFLALMKIFSGGYLFGATFKLREIILNVARTKFYAMSRFLIL